MGAWRELWDGDESTDGEIDDGENLPNDAYDLLDDEINLEMFDEVLERAIDKRCFIEVVSLIHNYIEFELYDLLIKKYIMQDDPDINVKIKLLEGKGKKYLSSYNELCFLSGLISKEQYDNIINFNNGRNLVIHNLLHQKTKEQDRNRYGEIIKVAILGRKIQMKFQEYPEEEITEYLKKFEISDEESAKDIFLTKTS